MGGVLDQARCRKHPKHRQSPGVCSACLRERLSQLSSSNKTIGSSFSTSSSSDASSYYSSASSASSPAEMISFNGYDRVTFVYGKRGLFRSRTVAAVMVPEKRAAAEEGKKTKKKTKKKKAEKGGGFWSKLIKGTRKRRTTTEEADLRSKTFREESSTVPAWDLRT